MSTEAQIAANRQNAQKSCGPRTEAGREASSYNHRIHGLSGEFRVMPGESQHKFDFMLNVYLGEHNPETLTEHKLVERMAEHQWLAERAIYLQNALFQAGPDLDEKGQKQFALYIRYQTTHERAHSRCLADLLKLQAERRKEGIGFESQKQKAAAESRREAHELRRAAAEKRTQERHEWDIRLAEAKVSHQQVLTLNAEMDGTLLKIQNPELQTARSAA